ncbi:hypothetical protein NSPZN2_11121 [Nitrospira defluvii]|uniref:Uncharacterized protein n=1 Tax=Nitrospira defluvii TaxID=330214 RepID=A0ABM8QPX7_9BACT|nr:hypothetical protein NSPZN2_11121 [Nitrospira defluvii]
MLEMTIQPNDRINDVTALHTTPSGTVERAGAVEKVCTEVRHHEPPTPHAARLVPEVQKLES